MMTYKDITFCAAKDCQKTDCPKLITPEILKEAKVNNLPLSVNNYQYNCDDYDPKEVCAEIYGDCS